MNFKKVNNISGWVVCLIACMVYILTMEANGSFWDCGEFVSSAYKLQIPHPPGAPLFVLMGRFFIILFGGMGAIAKEDDKETAHQDKERSAGGMGDLELVGAGDELAAIPETAGGLHGHDIDGTGNHAHDPTHHIVHSVK